MGYQGSVADLDYVGKKQRQRKERVIEVDDREDRDRITEVLLSGMGYTVLKQRLPLGDFQWDSRVGRVVVERKTPNDLNDIQRLTRQLHRLRDAARAGIYPILLLDYREGRGNPWADFDIDNAKLSVQGAVKVAHCLQGQLAHRLDNLYKWSQKAQHQLMEE